MPTQQQVTVRRQRILVHVGQSIFSGMKTKFGNLFGNHDKRKRHEQHHKHLAGGGQRFKIPVPNGCNGDEHKVDRLVKLDVLFVLQGNEDATAAKNQRDNGENRFEGIDGNAQCSKLDGLPSTQDTQGTQHAGDSKHRKIKGGQAVAPCYPAGLHCVAVGDGRHRSRWRGHGAVHVGDAVLFTFLNVEKNDQIDEQGHDGDEIHQRFQRPNVTASLLGQIQPQDVIAHEKYTNDDFDRQQGGFQPQVFNVGLHHINHDGHQTEDCLHPIQHTVDAIGGQKIHQLLPARLGRVVPD